MKLLCFRGGGGGRKGGRETKIGGSVSAYGRGRWEEAWRRGDCDQYWSAIEPVLVTYSNPYWSPREVVLVRRVTSTG